MDESQQLLNNLILSVTHVCVRMREVAESGRREAGALAPLRESIDMVLRTLDGLERLWEDAAAREQSFAAEGDSWLMDP